MNCFCPQPEDVKVQEVDFNPEFIARIIPKVDWDVLCKTAEEVSFGARLDVGTLYPDTEAHNHETSPRSRSIDNCQAPRLSFQTFCSFAVKISEKYAKQFMANVLLNFHLHLMLLKLIICQDDCGNLSVVSNGMCHGGAFST